jgi:hypothetical protein
MECFGDERFACLRTISIGRVDQVDTELDRAAQNLEGIGAIGGPAPDALAGDAHGAKAETIDEEIATEIPSRIGRERQGRR